jgi:hypothetical protein
MTVESLQAWKHRESIVVTEEGMQIVESGHPANTLAPITRSLDPDSNVTVDNPRQPAKQ